MRVSTAAATAPLVMYQPGKKEAGVGAFPRALCHRADVTANVGKCAWYKADAVCPCLFVVVTTKL
eukprot:scaffold74549_cov31-Tisochrysis_lutea.AAC.1